MSRIVTPRTSDIISTNRGPVRSNGELSQIETEVLCIKGYSRSRLE